MATGFERERAELGSEVGEDGGRSSAASLDVDEGFSGIQQRGNWGGENSKREC